MFAALSKNCFQTAMKFHGDCSVLPVSGFTAQSLVRCPTPAVQTYPPTYHWSLYSSTIMYNTVQLLLLDIFIFRVFKKAFASSFFFLFIMLIWPLWLVSNQKADSLSASTVFTGALLSSPLQQSYGFMVSASRTQTHCTDGRFSRTTRAAAEEGTMFKLNSAWGGSVNHSSLNQRSRQITTINQLHLKNLVFV